MDRGRLSHRTRRHARSSKSCSTRRRRKGERGRGRRGRSLQRNGQQPMPAAMEIEPPIQRPPTPPTPCRPTDGRPIRKIKRPARYAAGFPEPPPPAPPEPPPQPDPEPELNPHPHPELDPPLRRWVVTQPNSFGVYKVYMRQPTHDPDRKRQTADLCRTSELQEAVVPKDTTPWFHPFENATHALIMSYHWLEPKDSTAGTNMLLDIMRDPAGDFRQADIGQFKIEHGNKLLDAPPGEPPKGWNFGTVTLRVPPGKHAGVACGILEIEVPNILYRRLVDVMREAFTTPAFERLHTTPFSLRAGPKPKPGQRSPYDTPDIELDDYGLPLLPPGHQELLGEMYNSQRTFKAYHNLPACEEEPVIVDLMPFSDGTHLAQFGTASLQPGYLFLGNRSKYERAKPSANTHFHFVYFPKLPDDIKERFRAHYGYTMPDKVLAHLKRELFHRVWDILLDDEFLDAWVNGLRTDDCWDQLLRRLFPRFPTYGADYMDKILTATMKFLSLRPCPRCLILKADIPLTGTAGDLTRRQELRENTLVWRNAVKTAQRKIMEHGAAVDGDPVNRIVPLGENSFVPVKNTFTKITDAGGKFDIFSMFVPDVLHEVELGVFKSILTHLIRILYALDKEKVVAFDARFRQISAFGRSTIRKFHKNVSEMKKLAGRDFEDILQCLLPVCEGLFGEFDVLVQKLVFRFQIWHAYAKLRMHTTTSIARFRTATSDLCATIRKFARDTASVDTRELPREQAARGRAAAAKAAKRAAQGDAPQPVPTTTTQQRKPLNLETYKYHCLPDYPDAIEQVGTTDSYSTTIVRL
ncbi:hypothetical protein MKEN_00838600 [Mycena kentingensis (nom. inval.)]|nr:hypothetical protein MKEN_00838600 [Mycena kentingensis (nom. inval.)]